MTSQAALVNIQRVSKDCALSEVTRDGLDTAEVWGSSPHAPTNPFNKYRKILSVESTQIQPHEVGEALFLAERREARKSILHVQLARIVVVGK